MPLKSRNTRCRVKRGVEGSETMEWRKAKRITCVAHGRNGRDGVQEQESHDGTTKVVMPLCTEINNDHSGSVRRSSLSRIQVEDGRQSLKDFAPMPLRPLHCLMPVHARAM